MENKESQSEKLENENNEEEQSLDFKPLLDLLKTTLKDVNLEQILENQNKVKIEKIKAEKTHSSRNLVFWKWKFTKEFLIILVILISVVYLSFSDKIESSTIGTLLGSIIGYAIGNFNSKERKN
ncbi:MAG: hypothetical protein ACPG45_07720 [Flavobacteriaceae bacterium]